MDGCLGLVGLGDEDRWVVLRRGFRTGGHAFGNILTDTLCCGLATEPLDRFGPGVLFENAVVLLSSVSPDMTQRFALEGQASPVPGREDGCMAVEVLGLDDRHYLLIANLSDTPDVAQLEAEGSWFDVAAEPGATRDVMQPLVLEPLESLLLCER